MLGARAGHNARPACLISTNRGHLVSGHRLGRTALRQPAASAADDTTEVIQGGHGVEAKVPPSHFFETAANHATSAPDFTPLVERCGLVNL